MTTNPKHRRLLANRYQMIELIGSGAMGQVYRAEDKLLGGVTVAVKFLSQALLNERMRERFEQEATISALLGQKSLHIVGVKDYGVDEKEIPFYVMEFLQGESLNEIIKFQPLSLSRFLNLTRQICFGLECAHKGILWKGDLSLIIHRDIKPSNILVVQDQALGELVKILDFGIAKLIQSGGDQTQSFMGTLAYCSPEQMEGKELDSRSDIYSFGVMMYEMLTGDMPVFPENSSFGGWYEAHHYAKPQPFNSRLNLPSALENLIMKCLAKSPNDRPQSVSEILQALELIEPTYRDNRQNAQNLEKTLTADHKTVSKLIPSDQQIALHSLWPKDKPQQKIVFPQMMKTTEGNFASLWVMLNKEDIQTRMSSIRYNQFLFLTTPHPMILWITVLYHREQGPRWLPCYLDLKTDTGQRIARSLGESGRFWILFFSLEEPERCQNVITSVVAANQCKLLQEWANVSQSIKVGQPQSSKRLLKQELEKLKPKILMKLKTHYSDPSSDMTEV